MTVKRIRSWILVLNNYSVDERTHIHMCFSTYCDRFIIAEEVGTNNGTKHLQMFAHFKNGRTFDQVKAINSRMHIEEAKGSLWDNKRYCTKDYEFDINKVFAQRGMEKN